MGMLFTILYILGAENLHGQSDTLFSRHIWTCLLALVCAIVILLLSMFWKFVVWIAWLLYSYFLYEFVSEAQEEGWSWLWAGCISITTDIEVFQVSFHYVLHNCSSRIKPTTKSVWWGLLPSTAPGMSPICFNQITEGGFLSSGWFVTDGALRAPRSSATSSPSQCSRPAPAQCSPAVVPGWGRHTCGRDLQEALLGPLSLLSSWISVPSSLFLPACAKLLLPAPAGCDLPLLW